MIGGGQLALMMAEAATTLPLDLFLLAANPSDPAVRLFHDVTVGNALVSEDVAAFISRVDAVTVDHELVALDALRSDAVMVAPSAEALTFAQDKAHQRREFSRAGLPVPAFIVLDAYDEAAISDFVDGRATTVVKAAKGGYDGRGVRVVHGDPRNDIREVLTSSAVVLEEFLELRSELAVSVVTGRDGVRVVYPPVDTEQRDGMCVSVTAPSQLPTSLQTAATELALRVADCVRAVGVLAIELFVTETGLVVNEVATRPHNSGHWSIEGAVTSQFENHLRAVAGLSLGSTALAAPLSLMVNIVGGSHEPPWNDLAELRGVYVHHYGKSFRPGRKLGHVTVTGLSPSETAETEAAIRSLLTH